MSDLPRRTFGRTAKLASLPLSMAGRAALGAGKRIGGASADAVNSALTEATAEQLFTVLGELKGGAMKVGQAMSVLEAGLPEDLAGPYRATLTRLQEAAPPMGPQTVHKVLTDELGHRWRTKFEHFSDTPTAAASIGQVHEATWKDGRHVAVKIQYPGAGEALISDLKQLSRVARMSGAIMPGIELQPLLARVAERVTDELDYELEARNQVRFGVAYADSTDILIPAVVHRRGNVLVTEWIEGTPLSRIIERGTNEERSRAGDLLIRFLLTSGYKAELLHADPHPGNFRLMEDGRLGVLDFGAVDAMPGGLPPAIGPLLREVVDGTLDGVKEGLITEGFLPSDTGITNRELREFLVPFVDCLQPPTFTFTRSWLRGQVARFRDLRGETMKTTRYFNVPPNYVFIQRVWLSGVGVLCQLGAEVRARELVEEIVPGFAPEKHNPEQ